MNGHVSVIEGLGEIAPAYDLAFCDIWGVIHNGHAIFPGVADALARFRADGRTVILVSNAPRPWDAVATQLDSLGLPHSAYDAVVTSGDVTRDQIAASVGKAVFHLGPERDKPLFAGYDIRFAEADDCDVVICTGLFDDTHETPADYAPMLAGFHARAVPMVCANPDLVVDRGGIMIYCAGAIAQAYETLGGAVTTCGKPYRPIYDAAFARASELRGASVSPERTLAIGDSVRTDLKGAVGFGCGSLFIASGIHAAEMSSSDGALDPAALERFFARDGLMPDAVMRSLTW